MTTIVMPLRGKIGCRTNFSRQRVLMESLEGVNYALDAESGIFCIWRYNPGAFGSLYGNTIAVYRIPGGHMLQLDPEYSLTLDEMAVE